MPEMSEMTCPNCRYELPSSDAGVICPECGVDVGEYRDAFAIESSPRWYERRMVESLVLISVCLALLTFGRLGRVHVPWWTTTSSMRWHLLLHGVPAVLWVVASAKMLWPPPDAARVGFPRWLVIPAGICLALATPWQFRDYIELLDSFGGVKLSFLPGLEWGAWQMWVYVAASTGIQAAQLYLAAWMLERCGLVRASWWMLLVSFPVPVLTFLVYEASVISAVLLLACALFVHGTFRERTERDRHAAA